MIRGWNELVADLADLVGGSVGTLLLVTVLITAVVATLWYLWPIRIHWRWFRRGAGWRRERRAPREQARPEPAPAQPEVEEVPDLPAPVLLDLADQLAAQGRFAEAVRERLRALVRLLIEHEVIAPTPGLTVTELAAQAVAARPPLAAPVQEAVGVFAEIWYGQRPARAEDDQALRRDVEGVRAGLPRPSARGPVVGMRPVAR